VKWARAIALGTDGSAAATVSVKAGGHLHRQVPLRGHGSLSKTDQVIALSRAKRTIAYLNATAFLPAPGAGPLLCALLGKREDYGKELRAAIAV